MSVAVAPVATHCEVHDLSPLSVVVLSIISYQPVLFPVAYQVILEHGIGQFREFEPPRVHTRINAWGDFSCAQIDWRKARERELATTPDVNRRAVGLLNPMRDKN